MPFTFLERSLRFIFTLLLIGAAVMILQNASPGGPLGDVSLVNQRPALQVAVESLRGYLSAIALLAVWGLPLALLLGVPAGLRPGSPVDRVLQSGALFLIGVPSFIAMLYAIRYLAMQSHGTVSIPNAGLIGGALVASGWLARAIRDGIASARVEDEFRPSVAVVTSLGKLLQQSGNLLILSLPFIPGHLPLTFPSLVQALSMRDLPVVTATIGLLVVGVAILHLTGDLLVSVGARAGRPAVRLSPGMLVAGLALFGLLLLTCVASFGDPVGANLVHRNLPPGSEGYALGTDSMGRDLLARLAAGARTSMKMGMITTVIAAVVGGFLGLIGGVTGRVGAAIFSPRLPLPGLMAPIIAALIISQWMGMSLTTIMVAIGLGSSVAFAYPVRRVVMASSPARQGVLWAALGALLILFGQNLMAEAFLSFLGFGVMPPTPSLGALIREGMPYLRQAPHVLLPAIPIMLGFGGLMLAGHALTDAAGEEA